MSLSIADQNKLDAFGHTVKIATLILATLNLLILITPCWAFSAFLNYNCGDWGSTVTIYSTLSTLKRSHGVFGIFKIPLRKAGAINTNGGTESNMFGCYLGRELFPEGTLYYSKDTHSVAKIVKLLRIKSQLVESQPDGEMDYDDLINKIRTSKANAIPSFSPILAQRYAALLIISAEIQKRIAALGSHVKIIIYTRMPR